MHPTSRDVSLIGQVRVRSNKFQHEQTSHIKSHEQCRAFAESAAAHFRTQRHPTANTLTVR